MGEENSTFQCNEYFCTVVSLHYCPEKEQYKKKLECIISCSQEEQVMEKNIYTLLTARLNCPVKEEVSIKANTQCILPQRQQTRQDLKKDATSPPLMHALHT